MIQKSVTKGYLGIFTKLILVILITLLLNNCKDDSTINCGGAYSETEAAAGPYGSNDGPADNINTYNLNTYTTIQDLSITFTPGCNVSITGYMEPSGATGTWDYFKINTGDASALLITISWDNSSNSLNFYLKDSFNNDLQANPNSTTSYAPLTSDHEAILYPVRIENKSRYLLLSTEDPFFAAHLVGGVNYTIRISAY